MSYEVGRLSLVNQEPATEAAQASAEPAYGAMSIVLVVPLVTAGRERLGEVKKVINVTFHPAMEGEDVTLPFSVSGRDLAEEWSSELVFRLQDTGDTPQHFVSQAAIVVAREIEERSVQFDELGRETAVTVRRYPLGGRGQ